MGVWMCGGDSEKLGLKNLELNQIKFVGFLLFFSFFGGERSLFWLLTYCLDIGTPQKKDCFLCAETPGAAKAWVKTLQWVLNAFLHLCAFATSLFIAFYVVCEANIVMVFKVLLYVIVLDNIRMRS